MLQYLTMWESIEHVLYTISICMHFIHSEVNMENGDVIWCFSVYIYNGPMEECKVGRELYLLNDFVKKKWSM